jgi:hypothetical protein
MDVASRRIRLTFQRRDDERHHAGHQVSAGRINLDGIDAEVPATTGRSRFSPVGAPSPRALPRRRSAAIARRETRPGCLRAAPALPGLVANVT